MWPNKHAVNHDSHAFVDQDVERPNDLLDRRHGVNRVTEHAVDVLQVETLERRLQPWRGSQAPSQTKTQKSQAGGFLFLEPPSSDFEGCCFLLVKVPAACR